VNPNRSHSQGQYDGSTCFPLSSKEEGFLSIGKRATLLILFSICILFLLNVYRYNFISDDSFITLRYARNLVQGEGLVFNPGERVEGFTSMLWTLLLSLCGLIGIDLLAAARILGVVAGLTTIILTYRLFHALNGSEVQSVLGLFAPLMLAVNGAFACWAGSGMETALFVCLTMGSYLMVLEERWVFATVLTSACILTRPEGMLVFGLLFLFQFIRAWGDKKRLWLGWLLACGITASGLVAFRLFYFQDWLPNTFYAKTGGEWNQIIRGFKYLAEYCADYEGLLLIAAPVGYFLLVGELKSRFLAVTVVALWGATVWVGGDGLPMYRFALAPLPFLLVLQGRLIKNLCHHVIKSSRYTPKKVGYGLAIVVLFWAVIHLSNPIVGSHHRLYEYQKKVEIPRWTLVGKLFKENVSKQDSLAAVPIGAVSYYSELYVYDMLGLTNKHIARLEMPQTEMGWPGHEKHDGQYILSQKPTYLLLGNIDVTNKPRNPQSRPFIPYFNKYMWEREKDMFETDLIFKMYAPRSVEIAPDQYLNFYELREEFR
jgi:arabinofuranosyltransferase